ncbi:hypothetical protein Tco_0837655 [Tanacetum coccineum]
MNKLNALKTTTQHLERQTFTHSLLFERTFSRLFSNDVRTFKYELSQNMNNLEKQLNNEILHEKDSKSALSVIKVQFDKFIHSEMLKSSNYDSKSREARPNFKDYTQMEAKSFKDLIIQHMESIEKLQIQECMDQKVKASDASSGDKDCSRIVSDKGNDQVEVPYTAEYNVFAVDTQHSEQPECIINTCVVEKVDSNVIPDSPDMCDNEIQTDHNAVECDDERVALANLIANLKLDVDKNKKIQKQLKKANASLTQELKECKSTLAETSRTLGESNSIRDSCLIALQNKQTELEKELVDQAWEKHSHNHFCAPTALDMEVLIKTCLMPLAIKTQNDSFAFVHELKQEMHADLKYVESLENEIDELESNKAEFSNMYDILLQECVSNDVMCSYLHSLSDLDAHA